MAKLDILNRDEFVEQIVQLTENIAKNKKSVTFAIDGDWGCGKSFVLDLYENKLEQIQSEETASNKYLVIRYNCWKYDYYDEPIVAIVATILEAINEKTKLLHGEKKEKILGVIKAVGASVFAISTAAIKGATGVDFKPAFEVIKSGWESGKDNYEKMNEYDSYFKFNQALHSLQQVLNELNKDYTIVFLIDELDRCLPEYAIKVLERLHHLNENTNVINVIAIDKKQLYKSVHTAFGFEDVDLYLKKFIRFTVGLSLGDISERIMDKYPEYFSMFDMDKTPFTDSVEEFLQMIFRDIDVREQERLIEKAKTAHDLLFEGKKDYSFMCMELLIVVINSSYSNNRVFTQSIQNLFSIRSQNRELPPFAADFDSKFKELESSKTLVSGSYTKNQLGYGPINSLYARILCLWHEVIIKNSKYELTVSSGNSKLKLDEHIKELSDFYDMVRLIK